MKKLNSFPSTDGFKMPGEHEQQIGTWMVWPERTDNWRMGAKPAQQTFANVANTIAKYQPVTMCVSENQFDNARGMLNDNVRVIEMSSNDSWMRDVGCIFVKNDQGEKRAVDFIFNSWGGLDSGLYFPWDKDDQIAKKMAEISGVKHYRSDMVLEGGSIHVDGEGTLYTTEECLLNKNRNPDLSKSEIENNLKKYLGVTKVIWIPLGVYNDETNGHVDNLLHVVEPGHVVLTWTDDKNDPQYERSLKALKVLESETDAKGRKIKVTKIHQPGPLFYSTEETLNLDLVESGMVRQQGERLAGSYANYYICNDAVILPIFNVPTDQQAIKTLQQCYPTRKIEPIYAREILLGGGNIHCITQQEIK